MNKPIRVLYVDDNPYDRELVRDALGKKSDNFEVAEAASGKEFKKALEKGGYDLVLSDFHIAGFKGLEAFKAVRAKAPDIPVVIVTGTGSEEIAVSAMKLGVADYVIKTPKHIRRLPQTILAVLEKERLKKEHKRAAERIEHLNSVLRAIRGVNQLIVREKDRDRLIQGACEGLIATRGYYNAWIALLDESEKVVATAEAGLGEDFQPMIERLNRGEFTYCVRNALEQSGVLAIKDPVSQCDDCPLTRMYTGRNGLAIRLEHQGKIYGFMAVSVPDGFVADEEEQSLFEEVATDIAFALYNMKLDKERKKAEKALQESEEFSSVLLSASPAPIFVANADKSIKYVNPALEKTTGFSLDEIIGSKPPYPWWTEETLTKTTSDLEKAVKKGAIGLEELFKTKNEEEFWVEITSTPVRVNDEIKHYIANWVDITARKRTEKELRESEEKYRTVLEANPDPVVVYDIDGKVIYFNPAFTRVFGWTLEKCLGKKMDVFVPEEAWREMQMMLKMVLAGERFSGIETCRYNKKGEIISVSISGAIYKDQNGNSIGSVVNLRDISDQKKLEAQLQQAQKMEAIGTLAGGIAHDFNNILMAIMGYAEMTGIAIPKESEAHQTLGQVLKAGHRAKELVKQILGFARQSKEEKKPIKVGLIAKEVLKLLRASLPSTIEIRYESTARSDTVMADPIQIHQVLMNLCTNAHYAMSQKGGVLEISLSDVELDSKNASQYPDLEPGSYVKLTVSDTGFGMDQGTLERIFDPYFTTKEKGVGTGMGLAVVHGIIKSHRGAITVQSEPGKGSSFQALLPLVEMELKPEVEALELYPQGNERILFVDDEEPIMDLGKRMLGHLGYDVVALTSSMEALAVFREKPNQFDLVITDQTMPGLTGEMLTKEVMRIRPDTPVILCTGFSEHIAEEQARAIGIKAFLMKPLLLKDIAQTVRQVLDE